MTYGIVSHNGLSKKPKLTKTYDTKDVTKLQQVKCWIIPIQWFTYGQIFWQVLIFALYFLSVIFTYINYAAEYHYKLVQYITFNIASNKNIWSRLKRLNLETHKIYIIRFYYC